MKTQVQQFHNKEFGSVEIVLIDGKPYFPAAECARILGYTNPQKAIRDHCKGVNEDPAVWLCRENLGRNTAAAR